MIGSSLPFMTVRLLRRGSTWQREENDGKGDGRPARKEQQKVGGMSWAGRT
jgi:hypothetical protein